MMHIFLFPAKTFCLLRILGCFYNPAWSEIELYEMTDCQGSEQMRYSFHSESIEGFLDVFI